MIMITLFSEPAPSRVEPLSFALSISLHAALFSLAFLGLLFPPQLARLAIEEKDSLRLLELDLSSPLAAPPDRRTGADASPAAADPPAHGGAQAQLPAAIEVVKPDSPGLETLIQPEVPAFLNLPRNVHLPRVVLWAPKNIPTPTIVPPPPLEITAADVTPTLQLPNKEVIPTNVPISEAPLDPTTAMIDPGTASPVAVDLPDRPQHIPETASKHSSEPSQAQVVSLSDPAKSVATTVVPLAASISSGGSNAAAKDATSSGANSAATAATSANSPGTAATNAGTPGANGVANAPQPATGLVAAGGHDSAGSAPGRDSAGLPGGSGGAIPTRHITLPKNGKFNMVLVGNSVEEEYPETSGMWSGRLAYTVYLHVGLAKSWILQYSLPRKDATAWMGGSSRLEAPWPTDILVPDLPEGLANSDAIIVHGFLNTDGRLETLAAVYPPQLISSNPVLEALQQWVFRPATRNGQVAAVEVLLIIPEQD
jgi:hypothetical protein